MKKEVIIRVLRVVSYVASAVAGWLANGVFNF